jgi:hypothetical protein
VLDADWVVGVDLVAAWLIGSVAVAGPVRGAIAAPLVRLRDAPALVPAAPANAGAALRGAAFGGLLALPFGALFMSADAAFDEFVRDVLPDGASIPGRVFTFAVVLAAAVGLALAARRPPGCGRRGRRGRLAVPEWAIPLALLDILFLAFVVFQLTVLFGGHDHVLETAGLTYAEYARSGFWQLLTASALTLAVVALAVRLARARGRDRRLLYLLLGVLLACTGVVLASALHRLHLYEDAYGLTRARLTAEAVCLWLGGAIALVAGAGIARPLARRLAHLAVGGTAAALLAFSLSNPEARIAERNVDRWRETGRIDTSYLSLLSADAVPALAELPRPLRERALGSRAELRRHEPWSSANLSRARARAALAKLRSSP